MARSMTATTITHGRWAYYAIDAPMPAVLTIYEGSWERRRAVGTITRYQAMAYSRHWDNGGVYYIVEDGNRRRIGVYIVGDVDAFDGDADDAPTSGAPGGEATP
jgi:hypothetical protein